MNKQAIICIDDEVTVLNSLKFELEDSLNSDYLFEMADSPIEALQLLSDLTKESYEIPLVIADYILPAMKGDELLRRIHERFPKTIKVMLTGQVGLEGISNAIRYANLYRYIAKPWEADDLKLTVREALNSYFQEKKLAQKHLEIAKKNKALKTANEKQTQLIRELQQIEIYLKESESRYRALVDTAPDAIFVVNPKTRKIVDFNENMVKLFGHKQKKLLEMTIDDLSPLNQPYPIKAEANYGWASKIEIKPTVFEWYYLNARGQMFPCEVRLSKLSNQNDSLIRSSNIDITERKKMEAELKQYRRGLEDLVEKRTHELKEANVRLKAAKEAADDANRAKSSFLATMSHEIRTPMNVIINMGQLALEGDLKSKERHYLEKIDESAKSLLRIINDVLDFSKIEAGKLSLEVIEFRLEEIFEKLATLFADKIQEKRLEMIFDVSPSLSVTFRGDPFRLEQVLTNLVSNAIKFTEDGEIVISVDLIKEDEQYVFLQFSVLDSGVGLSDSQINRVFKAFSQGDSSTTRQYGGTGLGLAICTRIVKMMGGDLQVKSKPGKGSTFYFAAKFQKIGKSEKKIEAKDVYLKLGPKVKGLKILLLESNATIGKILKKDLEPFSSLVTLATNDKQATEVAKKIQSEETFDLVIMNWHLPGDPNSTYFPNFLKNKFILAIPKILVTNRKDHESVLNETRKFGVKIILSKPIFLPVLFGKIAALRERNYHNSLNSTSIRTNQKPRTSLQGLHVLIVDDDKINLQLIAEILRRHDAIITLSKDGEEAVQQVKEKKFDLVIMDLNMPKLDGYQATKKIRSDPQNDKLPIIAISGDVVTTERVKLLEIGMNDFIPKPFNSRTLIANLINWAPTSSGMEADAFVHGEDHIQKFESQDEKPRKTIFENLRSSLQNLAELLEKNDLNSLHKLAEICQLFGMPSKDNDLMRLRKLIRNYDFENARKELTLLTESLDIKLKSRKDDQK